MHTHSRRSTDSFVEYSPQLPPPQPPSIPQPGTVMYPTPELKMLQSQNSIYKELVGILKRSYQIPSEMLDDNKNLILPTTSLRRFIAQILEMNPDDIVIHSSALDEIGCCGCTRSLVHFITGIKIRIDGVYRSLDICYNEVYNRITEDFNISLTKVYNIRDN
jgi:hypothetical protein